MKTLRIGVIGTGIMGSDHAKKLSQEIKGATLVALADTAAEHRDKLAQELGVSLVYSDGYELIESKKVDAVLIAAPDHFHADLTRACIQSGIPVLCEKPLAPTSVECASIAAEEKKSGKKLVTVGFMRRFDPGYQALKNELHEGNHGNLLMTHSCHRNVEAPPNGDSLETITNSAIHEIDILPWLSQNPIVEVEWKQGRTSSLLPSRIDPQFILLTDSSGVLHTVEVHVHAQYGYDVRCELVCEKANVMLAPAPSLVNSLPLHISSSLKASVSYPADWRLRFSAAYKAELTAWVNAVLEGEVPAEGARPEDALRASLVAEAVITSMKSNGTATRVPTLER